METLLDYAAFERCARSLATRKAPGPDGIFNEVFKYGPACLLRCVHALLRQLAKGGDIPAALARSSTILLYKKNDPRDLNNYRPIGLANTLCKLWTKLLASVVSAYAERNHILNSGQAGFRARYYTHIQTQLLTDALEDARASKRDIFMMQVDFTNAFNRVNHRKLIRIMTDLGFPPTLVCLVHAVYC